MASSVSRYQPSNGTNRLPEVIERLFNQSFVMPTVLDRNLDGSVQSSLDVNLFHTTDAYVMQMALPGINVENLDIQVTGREVGIRGSFEVSAPEGGQALWQGIPNGQFRETYTLPVEIEGDKVEARYESGILTLTLPKAAHLRPKSIKVTATK